MKRFLLAIGLLMGLSLIYTTNAWCDSTSQEITELEKQISDMEKALSQMSSMDDQAHLRSEYQQLEQRIGEAQKQLSALQAEARRKAEEIARKKAEFRNMTEKELEEFLNELQELKEENSSGSRYLLEAINSEYRKLQGITAGDPVLVSSGQYIKTETDFSAIVPFERYYSTGSTVSGVLGKKWATVLDMHLEFGYNGGAAEISSNLTKICNYLLSRKSEYLSQFGEDDYTREIDSQYLDYLKQAQEYYKLSLECDGTGKRTSIGSENILLINEKGTPIRFSKTSASTWAPEKSQKGYKSLSKNGDKFFILQDTGDVTVFLEDGSILEKDFRNGNKSAFIRDSSGKITEIKNTTGGNLSFTYNGNLLSAVTQCLTKRTISYDFENGFLSKVTDYNGNSVTFSYTSRGFLKSITKADGAKVLFAYQSVSQDGTLLATSTTNEEGFSEYFEYYPSQRKTVYTSMDNNVTVYTFDSQEREIYRLDPDGTETFKTYDSNGNLSKETVNGLQTSYNYDSNGHFTSISTDGVTETYRWSEYGELLSYTDGDGITCSWKYDNKGNPESFYQGSKLMFSATYDEKSNLVSYKDYSGKEPVTYTFIYDENGLCKERKCSSQSKTKTETWTYRDGQPEKYYINGEEYAAWSYSEGAEEVLLFTGLKTVYNWNSRNDLVKITQTDTATGKSFATDISYDRRHNITALETDGLQKEMRYTAEGKAEASIVYGDICYITWYTWKNGFPASECVFSMNKTDLPDSFSFQDANLQLLLEKALEAKTTELERKLQNGNKVQITRKILDSAGNSVSDTFLFNPDSEVLKYTDALGQTFTSVYSAGGRLLKASNQFGGYNEFTFDSNGVYYSDEDPVYIFTEYDEIDRPVQVMAGDFDNASPTTALAEFYKTYTYSEDGRSITVSEGGLYSSTIILDAFGNIVSISRGDGNTTNYEYDSFGNLIKSTDPYGNKTLYSYDSLNRLTKRTEADGTQWKYSWDINGNCTKTTCDSLVTWEGKYDNLGNLLWEKGLPGIQKNYSYDPLGRSLQVITGSEVSETYDYSAYGRTVTFTDGNGASYCFDRDDKGRLVKETNRSGDECFYQYDDDGRLVSQTDFSGNTTTYEYKDQGKTTVLHYADGTYNSVTQNRAGLVTRIQNDYSCTCFEYDKAGNLVLQKDYVTGEEVRFQYNSRGLLSKRICKNQTVDYYYDKNGRLMEMMDMQNRAKVSFTYDSCGRELTRTFGNGNTQETKYDSAGRPTVIMVKNPRGEILWAEGYVYNTQGQREITVNEKGKLSLYRYDNAGRICEVLYSATAEMEEALRTQALELGVTVSENENCFENHYLSSEEVTKVRNLLENMSFGWGNLATVLQVFIRESFEYDKNGNNIKRKTGYFTQVNTYDAENRLVSSRGISPNSDNSAFLPTNYENSVIQYFYNKSGNLITKKGMLSETLYTYNASNRLISAAVIKKDGDSLTTSTISYKYDALGRRIFAQENQSSPKYTLYEGTTFTTIKEGPVTQSSFFTELPDSVKNTESQARYLFDSSVSVSQSAQSDIVWSLEYGLSNFAVSNGVDTVYSSSDLLGSTRFTSSKYGVSEETFAYDIFGTPIQGTFTNLSPNGFAGKPYDATTGFYDYGYRHYSPANGSFTTSDPVRDGTNWFSYCCNDPLNYIDYFGLDNIKILSTYKMNKGVWKDKDITGDTPTNPNEDPTTVGEGGCAITLVANIDSTRNGNLTPSDVNTSTYVKDGNVQWDEYSKRNDLTSDHKDSFTIYDYAAQEFDTEYNYYTGLCVEYCDHPEKDHWVGANGVKSIGGKLYFIISATSKNDDNVTSKEYRGYAGWKLDSEGNILVPASKVKRAYVFKESKCKEN